MRRIWIVFPALAWLAACGSPPSAPGMRVRPSIVLREGESAWDGAVRLEAARLHEGRYTLRLVNTGSRPVTLTAEVRYLAPGGTYVDAVPRRHTVRLGPGQSADLEGEGGFREAREVAVRLLGRE